jgi:hypothetical protein
MSKPPAIQGELFPFSAPETVLAHLRRLEGLTLSIGPELAKEQCFRLLSELAIASTVFEEIASQIRSGVAYRTRIELSPTQPRPPSLDDRIPHFAARHWHARRVPGWMVDAGNSS